MKNILKKLENLVKMKKKSSKIKNNEKIWKN